MRVPKILLGLLLAQLSTSALADWQYTRWGMTPEQVAAASKGTVRVGKGDPRQEFQGAEIGAVGTHVSGRYMFKANFHFIDRKLVEVRLKLIGGDQYALKNDLLALYGKPFKESGELLSLTTWFDPVRNNWIDLLILGPDYTVLEYRALKNDSALGL